MIEDPAMLGLYVVFAAFIVAVVWLNVWRHDDRQSMTPDQRKAVQDELDDEGRIW